MEPMKICIRSVAGLPKVHRICRRHLLQAVALCLALAAIAPAQVQIFRYSGVVTTVTTFGDLPQGSLPAAVVQGAPVTGSFVIDTSGPAFGIGTYTNAYGGRGMAAAVDECVLSSGPFEGIFVNVTNDQPALGDGFQANTPAQSRGAAICGAFQNATINQARVLLTLTDSTGTAFGSKQLPTTLNVESFDARTLVMGAQLGDLSGPGFSVEATITTVEPAQPRGGGTSQNDPVLPDIQRPGDFIFIDVVRGGWIDPPLAGGYEYSMLSDSLFTRILDFPVGFDAPFTVSVNSTIIGT